jgi:hypothetical protein
MTILSGDMFGDLTIQTMMIPGHLFGEVPILSGDMFDDLTLRR